MKQKTQKTPEQAAEQRAAELEQDKAEYFTRCIAFLNGAPNSRQVKSLERSLIRRGVSELWCMQESSRAIRETNYMNRKIAA